MASIRKLPNGKWIAEVRTKGKYKSRSHSSKAEAKSWADAEELKLGRREGIVEGKTLADAMKRYAREESPKKKGARWEIIRLEKLGRDELADIGLSTLRSCDIEDWIARQDKAGLKGASILREMQVLSAVLNTCRKRWKWLDHNPLEDVPRPKKSPHRDKVYSDEQVALILDALGFKGEVKTNRHRIAVAFLLAIETAMRQGEIFNIRVDDIHLDARFVRLPDTKNGEERNVPLTKRAVELINCLGVERGNLVTVPQGSAGTIFRRAVELAGLKGYTFHDARHTAVTRLARKLKPLDLAKMTGHKDIRMLNIYYNPTATDIAHQLD